MKLTDTHTHTHAHTHTTRTRTHTLLVHRYFYSQEKELHLRAPVEEVELLEEEAKIRQEESEQHKDSRNAPLPEYDSE